MAPLRGSPLSLLCVGLLYGAASIVSGSKPRCFPPDFLFGTATAAFQVEGAWNESGREPSIWDDYCRSQPDLQCADVADDFFHRYRDDVALMDRMGLSSFRFSISWSRLMHSDGAQRMAPTPQGIAFYHALLDDLQSRGLTAIVTLYHFDLPSTLQTLNGWLNPDMTSHFEDFAALAFSEFGHKVKYWATFNEPLTFISGGYGSGDAAPGGMAPSATNTYAVAHNVLHSHAKAVARFRSLKEEGVVAANARVGIVLNAEFGYPVEAANALDVAAAERKMQFDLGWFLTPLVTGDYPAIMRERVGERLPRFTSEEAALVKGSFDVHYLNHYYSRVVTDCDSERSEVSCEELPLGHARDRGIDDTRAPNGARRPPASNPECAWLAGYPAGYLAIIKWLHAKDPSTEILLTENGWCGGEADDGQDQLEYFQAYVEQVHKALAEDKIPIIGYTAWSLLDNNEWGSYKPRFGLHYVNYSSPELPRLPRPAATWFAQLSTTKCLDGWGPETTRMDTEEKQEAKATREQLHDPEAGGDDVGVPWSLNEVIVLLVVGVGILGGITCEAMRELHQSSQGSSEEMQVLVTIED
jgi:beta-glucosidase/6-phospho-beta-glucosidase/beta-galactosidase